MFSIYLPQVRLDQKFWMLERRLTHRIICLNIQNFLYGIPSQNILKSPHVASQKVEEKRGEVRSARGERGGSKTLWQFSSDVNAFFGSKSRPTLKHTHASLIHTRIMWTSLRTQCTTQRAGGSNKRVCGCVHEPCTVLSRMFAPNF